jgi:glycosyltransferase involved in cell wall biosynthesis
VTAAGDPSAAGTAVTVVLTTHNRPEMAVHALGSALAQSLPPAEVVIVDDGSVPPFELRDPDPRVRLVRLPEARGVSAARNAGLAAASGELVTFLDDDDELLPDMLEISLRAASRSRLPRPVAVLSGVETVGPGGAAPWVRLPVSLTKGRDYFLDDAPAMVGNTLVMPREVLASIGGFDEQLRCSVHSELLLRVNAVCSIEAVPTVTYRIKRHHEGHIHDDPLGRAQAMVRTERRHRTAFGRHRRRHALYLAAAGIWYLKAGRWGPAVTATTRALAVDPLSVRVVALWLVSLGGPASLALHRKVVRPIARRRRPGTD